MNYNLIHSQVLNKDRKRIYPHMNDIIDFLLLYDIQLFGVTKLEYDVTNSIDFKKPITVITNHINDIFITFFKDLHDKYKKTKNKVFFSLPTKQRYRYIYHLNLHPVLIVYFNNDLPTLASLRHLYYEYTLPLNNSSKWNEWVKIEHDFLMEFNKPLKLKDELHEFKECYTKYFEYFKNNDEIIITGKHAYDVIFQTSFFYNEPVEIIVSSYDIVKELCEKFELEEKKIEKDEILYFYGMYELYSKGKVVLKVFHYSRLINFITIGKLNFSNFHGVFFHLLYENLDNSKYIQHGIPLIDVDKERFKVFQINYKEIFAKNILENKVKSYYNVEKVEKV